MERYFFRHLYHFIVNTNRNFLRTLVLLGFILSIIFSARYRIEIPRDTLYWFLSTIAQSLVALVALVGLLIIYRFQFISSSEEGICDEELRQQNTHFVSTQELLDHIETRLKNAKDLRLARVKLKLMEISNMKKKIYEFMLEFTIYTLSVIGLNLLFLMFTHIIYKNFALPILYGIFILTIYSFFLVIRMIPGSLFGDYSRHKRKS